MSSIYRYADVTYVGGGFGVGIHNTLEAAVWGVPVILGGGFEITGYEDFERLMKRFETDAEFLSTAGQQAGAYVSRQSGATRKILSDLQFCP